MEYYTVVETSRVLRVHDKTIRRLIRAGKIPGVRRIGRRVLIPRAWVEGRTAIGENAA